MFEIWSMSLDTEKQSQFFSNQAYIIFISWVYICICGAHIIWQSKLHVEFGNAPLSHQCTPITKLLENFPYVSVTKANMTCHTQTYSLHLMITFFNWSDTAIFIWLVANINCIGDIISTGRMTAAVARATECARLRWSRLTASNLAGTTTRTLLGTVEIGSNNCPVRVAWI